MYVSLPSILPRYPIKSCSARSRHGLENTIRREVAAADDIAATFRVGGWKARVVEREGPDSPEPDRAYRVRLDHPDGLRTDWPIQYDNGTIGYDSEAPPAAQKATEEAFGWIAHWMDNRQLALFAFAATKGKEPMSGKISDNVRAEARNSVREIMRLAQYIQGTENVKYAKAISTHALDLESFLVMEAEISHDGGYHRASRLIDNATRPAGDR